MNYPEGQTQQIDVARAFGEMNYPDGKPEQIDVARLFNEMNGLPVEESGSGIKGPKTEAVVDDGVFLFRVVITMWCFIFFNCCCLSGGFHKDKEGGG